MPKSYSELLEKSKQIQKEIGELEDDLLSLYSYVLPTDIQQVHKGIENERLLMLSLQATKDRSSKARILISSMIESALITMEGAGWWGD
jgi:hypothetical protein